MRPNGGVKPIGCHDKFHHIVNQNVIDSVRIACLCFSLQFQWNLNAIIGAMSLQFPRKIVSLSSSFTSKRTFKSPNKDGITSWVYFLLLKNAST